MLIGINSINLQDKRNLLMKDFWWNFGETNCYLLAWIKSGILKDVIVAIINLIKSSIAFNRGSRMFLS